MMQQSQAISFSQKCQICYCRYELGNLHTLRPEGICYNCWYQHIKTVITQISYKVGSQIISPFQGKDPIDICIALKSLQPQQEVDLEQFLFKKYTSFTNDIEKCPQETCDYVFTMQKCKWGTKQNQKCPKCEAILINSDTIDIKTLIGFIYFLFLTNKCPKCEIPIQKTTGCPHMSCPCGHQFCWYCLKDYYPSESNIYSVHQPKECITIFISKIIFTFICISGIFLTLLGNQIFQKLMGYFYVGLGYLFHTLLLDVIITVNIILINNLFVTYNRGNYNYNSFYKRNHSKYVIGGLILGNILILCCMYYLEMLIESGIILLIELAIVGIGALIVFLVIQTAETWFKYIC